MGYCTYMTRAGYELQAKLFAGGGDFHVTRVEVGRGAYPEGTDCSAVTGLADAAARATSTTPVRKGCEVSLTVEYRSDLNGGLEEAFLITEFGLFAVGAEGREELILYGDISDYPETAVPQKYGGCVRQYPVSIVIGPNAGASLGYPAGAWMTAQDVADALAAHDADLGAHAAGRRVLAVREREAGKPTYGLDGGGQAAVLRAGPYTGGAEVSVLVSGVEYDAENLSVNGDNAPDGTLILRKMED